MSIPLKQLVQEFEGCRLEPYYDSAGYPTIGWGHLLSHTKNTPLNQWQPITQDEADALLDADLAPAIQSATWLSPSIAAMPNKLAAIADFIYNLGAHAYANSTLRRAVDRQDWTAANAEFEKWDHAGGVEVAGLKRRRLAEQALFATDN